MKLDKWVALLATLGGMSLVSAACADEKMNAGPLSPVTLYPHNAVEEITLTTQF
jgi:hypothetical protein